MATEIEYGKRVPGCAFCLHANKDEMNCYPDSEDCKSRYALDEDDFTKEFNCDFFIHK